MDVTGGEAGGLGSLKYCLLVQAGVGVEHEAGQGVDGLVGGTLAAAARQAAGEDGVDVVDLAGQVFLAVLGESHK